MTSILGQKLFIGVSGPSLTSDEKKFIRENCIGGVTLFGRNLVSPEQIYELCKEIQSLRKEMSEKVPLFIGIDMEGGRVHRFKAPFSQFPAQKKLGDRNDLKDTETFASLMSIELKAVGVNLNYSPCLDVFTNPENKVIGDRSFSSDPNVVTQHGLALIAAFKEGSIFSCAKHFPGHGNTLVDSHDELPIENTPINTLRDREWVPFAAAAKSNVDFLMSAHILFPEIDREYPATLSETFMKNFVRRELGFKGFLISDDLGMKALSARFPAEEIPIRGLEVGLDFLLYCNEPETPPIALEALAKAAENGRLSLPELKSRHNAIMEFKSKLLLPRVTDFENTPFDIKKIGATAASAFCRKF